MENVAEHIFSPKSASLALRNAVSALAIRMEQPESEFAEARMGDLYDQAVAAFGAELPDFWRVWQSWNEAPDTPAEWGDL